MYEVYKWNLIISKLYILSLLFLNYSVDLNIKKKLNVLTWLLFLLFEYICEFKIKINNSITIPGVIVSIVKRQILNVNACCT